MPKRCKNCGLLNFDEETHCVACGATEFEPFSTDQPINVADSTPVMSEPELLKKTMEIPIQTHPNVGTNTDSVFVPEEFRDESNNTADHADEIDFREQEYTEKIKTEKPFENNPTKSNSKEPTKRRKRKRADDVVFDDKPKNHAVLFLVADVIIGVVILITVFCIVRYFAHAGMLPG